MLQAAMREVGAAPQETLLIGDTVFDVEMAGNAGVAAFGVSWGYHDPGELSQAGARTILGSFDELRSQLERSVA
jgi:phosphoglycolate phosphatase